MTVKIATLYYGYQLVVMTIMIRPTRRIRAAITIVAYAIVSVL